LGKATNDTSDQVVNQVRGRQMRRKKEEGNEKGGNLFLIEQVQRNALCVAHCAAIFIYSYSSSHNIQLLISEVSSFATEK